MKINDTWRSVFRIAKIELNVIFCSPVAWLVLIIFAFQAGLTYADLLNNLVHEQAMGEELSGITSKMFGQEGYMGGKMPNNFFTSITSYLFLYLPLITMGLFSREYRTGSIKLLFSSPVRTNAIVLGKFGAMLVYSGILTAIIVCYIIYSGCVIEHFDWPQAWTGLLGVFLLICTYSAIGLFMSSVTSYPVVAAVGTLALFAVLNYIGEVGQGIAFVRDITYWLALSGKVNDFIMGVIPSESVIYFIALIAFFLVITILKLEDMRTRRNRKITLMRYAGMIILLISTAYISSRPACKFYHDSTRVQANTLSNESLDVLTRLDGDLKITTYVNVLDYLFKYNLPIQINDDIRRFQKYSRFKPEIEMEYVYYWNEVDNRSLQEAYPNLSDRERAELVCKINNVNFNSVLSPDEIKERIDLSVEDYRTVRLVERGNGQKEFLREYNGHTIYPREPEITAAFKRMTDGALKIAFIKGHGDREITNKDNCGYWWATIAKISEDALINTGFDPVAIDLEQEDIPTGTGILVLADLQTPMTDSELQKVKGYIEEGGNLLIMAEYGTQQNMAFTESLLGVRFSDEVAVCPVKDQDPTIVWAQFTQEAAEIFPDFANAYNRKEEVVRKNVMHIDYTQVENFRVIPLYVSDSTNVWLEKETRDFHRDPVVFNPSAGERKGCYTFALTLDRQIGNKEQRIAVMSDPTLLTMESYSLVERMSANRFLKPTLMRWLSGDEYPILALKDLPTDKRIKLKNSSRNLNKALLAGVLPLSFLVIGLIIIRKRKRG